MSVVSLTIPDFLENIFRNSKLVLFPISILFSDKSPSATPTSSCAQRILRAPWHRREWVVPEMFAKFPRSARRELRAALANLANTAAFMKVVRLTMSQQTPTRNMVTEEISKISAETEGLWNIFRCKASLRPVVQQQQPNQQQQPKKLKTTSPPKEH